MEVRINYSMALFVSVYSINVDSALLQFLFILVGGPEKGTLGSTGLGR